METLVQALTKLVSRDYGPANPRPAAPRPIEVDLGAAPPCVRALAEALAAHFYRVNLGHLSMFQSGSSSPVCSLESTLEMSCENGAIDAGWVRANCGADKGAFDPACTIELGADGGGMSYFGVSWSGGTLSMVLVELEDPIEDNIVEHFATAEAFLAFLDERNADRDSPLADVAALKAAV
ncbi:MAG: hypothetical protein IT370_02305 [Deltaproteobacteria bacterium]|nr:hypothetical protein [Deltaproteobacteria bacterium]